MDEARAAEGLSRLRDEINSEKAAALARIAGTLEALLADLQRIAAEAAAAEAGRERSLARHHEVRERALRYRWYLEVQREAVGLTWHEALDELYPVPEPLDAMRAGVNPARRTGGLTAAPRLRPPDPPRR